MRSASGNGFDSSDSFAVSGAAERTARLHDIPPSITPSHGDDSHLLSRIASPADVKALAPNELAELCREIRTTLLAYGHQHGGHIGSNLGMVEATVALHRVFDSPRDRIVFDVSHQSYVHKMLTGRAAAYLDPDRFSEVTGFTNPDESKHDQFVLGHTGTSISLACGLAKTRDMEGPNSGIGNVIAVIGDGSLSSGVAFEGLNNAAEQGGNLIIVFNDNEMSIAGDFGGMYGPLARLRASGGTAQPNLFNAFGLDYRYVEAGNDVSALVAAFEEVRDIDHPVVVHIHTLKGAGYDGEETHADRQTASASPVSFDSPTGVHPTDNVNHSEPWHSDHCNLSDHEPHEGQCEASHWQNPDAAIGKPDDPRKHYGKMAMAALEPRFAAEPGLVVISPATPGSNGITHEFRERAGAHYVDTGITESHAVAYAAGIARAGGTPVVATTASFFQRAYDQFFQEMSLNRSRVTVLDFLGGLSGSDNTHSGAYDVTMFSNIPGATMLVPTSARDYLADLAWATAPAGSADAPAGPVVIRVPGEAILTAERDATLLPVTGGQIADRPQSTSLPVSVSSASGGISAATVRGTVSVTAQRAGVRHMLDWRVNQTGSHVAIIGLGNAYPLAEQTAAALSADYGITATGLDPRHQQVITLEDGQLEGGWGEKVTAYYANHHVSDGSRNPHVLNFGAAKEFTDRVPLGELNERYGLTVEQVTEAITRCF